MIKITHKYIEKELYFNFAKYNLPPLLFCNKDLLSNSRGLNKIDLYFGMILSE